MNYIEPIKNNVANYLWNKDFNETNILSITDEDELEAYLIDQRNLLTTESYLALCRQELYDLTTNQILILL